MKRDSELLDPYCGICGRYKGVGPCRYSDCPGSLELPEKEQRRVPSPHGKGMKASSEREKTCCLCNEAKSVECSACGRPYCAHHSRNRLEVVMNGPDHYIGTCVQCGKLVCEHCWILDNLGRINCVKHLEKRNAHDSQS